MEKNVWEILRTVLVSGIITVVVVLTLCSIRYEVDSYEDEYVLTSVTETKSGYEITVENKDCYITLVSRGDTMRMARPGDVIVIRTRVMKNTFSTSKEYIPVRRSI